MAPLLTGLIRQMTITTRQESLLGAIMKEYIRQARPVSSNLLVERDDLDVSPATVRNDMMDLTDAGYLSQPHTSAGRVPTEKAWHWYIKHVLKEKALSKKDQDELAAIVDAYRQEKTDLLRRLAKAMAELASESVVVGFGPSDTYYTGLSNVFAQPEFEAADMMMNFSRVIDHLDEVMARMFHDTHADIRILVGRENPFGADCGVIVTRYTIPRGNSGIIGVLGPMRQDYDEHVAMVKYAQKLLNAA